MQTTPSTPWHRCPPIRWLPPAVSSFPITSPRLSTPCISWDPCVGSYVQTWNPWNGHRGRRFSEPFETLPGRRPLLLISYWYHSLQRRRLDEDTRSQTRLTHTGSHLKSSIGTHREDEYRQVWKIHGALISYSVVRLNHANQRRKLC